jgi:hypothetical protein
MVIMAHYPFLTHKCQGTQIKNPFASILGFDLIKGF